MTRTEEGHSPPGGTGTGPALPDGTGDFAFTSSGGMDVGVMTRARASWPLRYATSPNGVTRERERRGSLTRRA